MPTFSPQTFPHVLVCADCPHGTEVEVTYEDASTLAPEGATEREAVNHVLLVKHGWYRQRGSWTCQECMEDLE
jgi:hypothetical protein